VSTFSAGIIERSREGRDEAELSMPLSDIDCACGGEGDVVGSARASEVGMVDELVYVSARCALRPRQMYGSPTSLAKRIA
jgi:hypothetical protein